MCQVFCKIQISRGFIKDTFTSEEPNFIQYKKHIKHLPLIYSKFEALTFCARSYFTVFTDQFAVSNFCPEYSVDLH